MKEKSKSLGIKKNKLRSVFKIFKLRTVFVQNLGALLEKFKKLKNNSEKNKIQVLLTNNGLRDLKEDIEYMSEQEKDTENPNKIVNTVEKILKFNRQQPG